MHAPLCDIITTQSYHHHQQQQQQQQHRTYGDTSNNAYSIMLKNRYDIHDERNDSNTHSRFV